ncbi:MAG: hypothetical protein WBY44_37785 [Bryobacteraceae bacterium]
MLKGPVILSKTTFCQEKLRLMEEFLAAATDLVSVHNDQVKALIEDDPDFSRFDLLIHLANERKRLAKYNYLVHLENHRC